MPDPYTCKRNLKDIKKLIANLKKIYRAKG